MLPKKYRLSLKTEFRRIKNQAKVNHSRSFSLLVCASDQDCETSQFAFIVSKKIDKRAVERNRAKRRLSAAVGSLLPQVKNGFQVVFLARKTILTVIYKELVREIESAFQRAGLLK